MTNFISTPVATLIRAFLNSVDNQESVTDLMRKEVSGELLESSYGDYSFFYGNRELHVSRKDSNKTRCFIADTIDGIDWSYSEF